MSCSELNGLLTFWLSQDMVAVDPKGLAYPMLGRDEAQAGGGKMSAADKQAMGRTRPADACSERQNGGAESQQPFMPNPYAAQLPPESKSSLRAQEDPTPHAFKADPQTAGYTSVYGSGEYKSVYGAGGYQGAEYKGAEYKSVYD